ncbi:hypothetical protein ID866_7378 [Astraeus odoratus]|nr:hypothetical protein ID866_7378 [Astraeus odoratus]
MRNLNPRKYLVTGGHGFIGSHVAKALFDRGFFVRVADINPSSQFSERICTEAIVGNLCDVAFCERVVRGVDAVLHFAATMGGMGVIHEENDLIIYQENDTMTVNILSASIDAKVRLFFYASSACTYPVSLQANPDADVSLKESDTWAGGVPRPQGLYGLEKLVSELVIPQAVDTKMEVRIARFHNVYGPRGAWRGGREKAPAALLRKALIASALPDSPANLEIWGDGKQRRSFLYIEDCVDAILLLLDSSYGEPINIGSDQPVTINFLADIACRCAGLSVENIRLDHVQGSRPIGVSARNADNELVMRILGWSPKVSLLDGMRKTAAWIQGEIRRSIEEVGDDERESTLRKLQQSQVVNLTSEYITFAIILPITSRGSDPPTRCLCALRTFAESLERTTWRDTHQIGDQRFRVKVYLAIDDDDSFLRKCDDGINVAEAVLLSKNICNVVVNICNQPPGHICSIWRRCAKQAWKDDCDYFVLMGDDVVLKDEGWMREAHAVFTDMSRRQQVPFGIGCVAFTDVTFPGMPTFPIIHRTHMDIFDGDIIPDNFINQDGDPFLYQLYRRWNCSHMFPSRITNGIGGSFPARYTQQHADGWTFRPLDRAVDTTERWLLLRCPGAQRRMTIDVVVPSYRVQLSFLDKILNLQPSPTCTVMFIIIVDDPASPSINELEKNYGIRPDVRIRINPQNLGASASRNRGMKESAADWIIFLDDDIVPHPHLLKEAENIIRKHPKAAGFIGNVRFPQADTVFKTAVHLAGVTYFWDIAEKMSSEEDMPWGVTANLIMRRVEDGVEYGLQFPKTGGGEDIDFIRRKREYSITHGGEGFYAAPEVLATHPWWNEGKRSYLRFFMWSKGDGHLCKLYPNLTYLDHAPNSAELLLLSLVLGTVGVVAWVSRDYEMPLIVGILLATATVAGNIVHDMFRYLWRDTTRAASIDSALSGMTWVLAVIESTVIRLASELGRLVGQLERKEFSLLGRRFEWFAHRAGNIPMNEERMNSRQRLMVVISILAFSLATTYKV